MPTYDDLESAFYFVICNFEDTNRAVYDKVTDQFFMRRMTSTRFPKKPTVSRSDTSMSRTKRP